MVASVVTGPRHRPPPQPFRASAGTTLTARRAALLGAVQGPAELLPVSSSAHLALIPWLAGWRWDRLGPERRKELEVALHAATAAAMLTGRRVPRAAPRRGERPPAIAVALAALPPAIAGYRLERPIERRLGGPGATSAGLIAGALALALAGRREGHRAAGSATAIDGLALGVAQAAALAPGVSRSGATIAAALLRGFGRRDAATLSRAVGLPVLAGAAALKGLRLTRRGVVPELRRPLACGAAAAFASTLAADRALGRAAEAPPWPYAAYRAGLAAAVLARRRRCG